MGACYTYPTIPDVIFLEDICTTSYLVLSGVAAILRTSRARRPAAAAGAQVELLKKKSEKLFQRIFLKGPQSWGFFRQIDKKCEKNIFRNLQIFFFLFFFFCGPSELRLNRFPADHVINDEEG